MGMRADTKTARMSIDVSIKDHKRIKILAAAEGISLRKFVIECVAEKVYSKKAKHPNKTTLKAMEHAKKGKTIKAKNFDDICDQLGI